MKNPLHKRIPKEFIGEIGKYLVIFIFMVATIGFVSGFLVADDSMIIAYDESFDKYNIEDGNFEIPDKASDEFINTLEKSGVKIYENNYVEKDVDDNNDGKIDSNIRIFINRTDVDKVCLMSGKMPNEADEIAIDRMYADNNNIKAGNEIEVDGKKLKVTGLVALSDYSALFEDNGDSMFDAVKFGVAVMTNEGYKQFTNGLIHYSYAWKYVAEPKDEDTERKMSDEFLSVLSSNTQITKYIPKYSNQAIQFTGNDMGSDRSMITTLLYILIVIMAFVFAVTTNNTITKEAAVIGTLRASGYTRGELLRHYIALPIVVTLLASLIGNIFGYTIFKNICAGLYYGSYSLPTYITVWNVNAFVLTTVVPIIIMIIINLLIISSKLKLSPLKFLRHDLSKSKNKKAVKLPHIKFFSRFRIRIVLQNLPSYFTLFIGIIFANLLLLFGMMVSPLLSHYQDEILDNMISDYQYVLKAPIETTDKNAEKYCATELNTTSKKYESEGVTIYGIEADSKYLDIDFKTGIYISKPMAEKYSLKTGDNLKLKDKYSGKTYEFEIGGIYDYPASLSVFMSEDNFRKIFELDDNYFNGYFSNDKLDDIDEKYVASEITLEDLTKISRQLDVSMGEMFKMVKIFALILFALLIYLLTKLIIEKNATSISMAKILGYENIEIARLYLLSTTGVVLFSTILSFVICTLFMKVIYGSIMADITGWISFYVLPSIYPKMLIMGMGVYAVIALLQFMKIKKVPMDEALKNVE